MASFKIIVDANILFSFFKKDSVRRQVFEELLSAEYELLSPHFVLVELRSDADRIMQFSGISKGEFEFALSILEEEIKLMPEEKYNKFLSKASEISPHTKDIPYFALSLSLNCPIWSDEKAFKEQSKVKVFTTEELIKSFSS